MEIKIQCPCGTRYKFDADPALGRLPGPVACPICGKDGTDAGNAFLRSAAVAAPAIPTPAVPALSTQAPMVPPISPAPASAPEAAPAGSKMVVNPSRLQVRTSHKPASDAAPALTVAAAPPPTAPPIPLPAASIPRKTKTDKPAGEPSIPRAIVGATIGAFIGALVWYAIIKSTGVAIGWVAWGVGIAAGLGARLGRDRGPGYGAIAAICAAVAIIGGQYLALSHLLNEEIKTALKEQYDEELAYAKKAVAARTDADFRRLLADADVLEVTASELAEITVQDIAEFKKDELPKLKDFANGKPSRAQFEAERMAMIQSLFPIWALFANSFGILRSIIWIFLGIGSAYRLASG